MVRARPEPRRDGDEARVERAQEAGVELRAAGLCFLGALREVGPEVKRARGGGVVDVQEGAAAAVVVLGETFACGEAYCGRWCQCAQGVAELVGGVTCVAEGLGDERAGVAFGGRETAEDYGPSLDVLSLGQRGREREW